MDSSHKNQPIKNWSEEERPREKLQTKGRQVLTDSELLAILIGSGSIGESALDLSKRILAYSDHSLDQLGRLNLDELQQFKGIGEAKAITIAAALELGRRRQRQEPVKRKKIITSRDAFDVLEPILSDLDHEEFWIILLNRNSRVIGTEKISSGGVAHSIADAKLIFRPVLARLASMVILAHNHPSGNLNPSAADIALTDKLVKAGKVLDVKVADHIIIGHKAYYSFSDEGQI